jgi:hypothetical protein
VTYNCTASAASADGRRRDGDIPGFSVEADSACGPRMDKDCAWGNVFDEIVDVAEVGNGDFDVVKTGSQNWEFRWYNEQLGDDVSGSLVFSTQLGNMANAKLSYDKSNEKTVAIVGGEGEEEERNVEVVYTDTYSASADYEIFVDARNQSASDSRIASGCTKLQENRAKYELSFDVVQKSWCYYGLHYGLGDKVKVVYGNDYSACMLVDTVSVSYESNGAENIKIELVEA